MSKKKTAICHLINKFTQAVHKIETRAIIGRNKTSDLCITNTSVSRSHCTIQHKDEDDSWTITDIGSTAGTTVNNMKLGCNEAMQLKNGDEIMLAAQPMLTYKFHIGKYAYKRSFSPDRSVITITGSQIENIDAKKHRSVLQASQDEAAMKLFENVNEKELIENNFKIHSQELNNSFTSQTHHLNSESTEYKTVEKTFEEEFNKLKLQKEIEIQKLCTINDDVKKQVEELQKRLDMNEKMIMEYESKQIELIKHMQKNEAQAEANQRQLQKENDEKEKEVRELKEQLKHKENEIEKKNTEKMEELNSLKEDLKLAVSKKEENESVMVAMHLNAISDRIESEMLCSICSEFIIEPTCLNCAHIFCYVCITMWMKKKVESPLCPMCRVRITSVSKCSSISSLLDSVLEELPSLKRKRQELMQERFGKPKHDKRDSNSNDEDKQVSEAHDVFEFPQLVVIPSVNPVMVTGPVEQIDLTLDDSVLVIESRAPIGRLQNSQPVDLTVNQGVQQHRQRSSSQTNQVASQMRLRRNRRQIND